MVLSVENPRLGFGLNNLQSDKYISHRVALIGDAAHIIHPMAGQGLNLGIHDANLLTNTIQSNIISAKDIGLSTSLLSYQIQAKLANYNLQLIL